MARSAGQGGPLARPRGSDPAAHDPHRARRGAREPRSGAERATEPARLVPGMPPRARSGMAPATALDQLQAAIRSGRSVPRRVPARPVSGRRARRNPGPDLRPALASPGYGTAWAGEIERIRASVAGLKISAGGVAAVWWLPAAVGAGQLVLLASHRDQVSQIVFVDSDPAIGIARLPSDDGA